jgi:hypothetical protein
MNYGLFSSFSRRLPHQLSTLPGEESIFLQLRLAKPSAPQILRAQNGFIDVQNPQTLRARLVQPIHHARGHRQESIRTAIITTPPYPRCLVLFQLQAHELRAEPHLHGPLRRIR